MPRIYLDNAATSWPKRPGVAEAMTAALELGANYGRGQTVAGDKVRRVVDRCRSRLATLFSITDASNVVFTAGGTDALHLAINGLLRQGDRVVTTAIEHNAVLRPLFQHRDDHKVDLEIVPVDHNGYVDPNAVIAACKQPTRLLVISHASNVTGAIQDVAAITAGLGQDGPLVLLDACQTAGHTTVNTQQLGIDILVTSGHKGLGGPMGIGVLAFSDRCREQPQPVRLGGTGGDSESPTAPSESPARYEAGTLNVPGIFGLDAALETLTIPDGNNHPWIDSLAALASVTLVGPNNNGRRVGVASITVEGWSPHDLATVLETEFGIETRAGLHCSPLAHEAVGTKSCGGTLRISPPDDTPEVPEWLISIQELLGAKPA